MLTQQLTTEAMALPAFGVGRSEEKIACAPLQKSKSERLLLLNQQKNMSAQVFGAETKKAALQMVG
jgi:hypothetical protein